MPVGLLCNSSRSGLGGRLDTLMALKGLDWLRANSPVSRFIPPRRSEDFPPSMPGGRPPKSGALNEFFREGGARNTRRTAVLLTILKTGGGLRRASCILSEAEY